MTAPMRPDPMRMRRRQQPPGAPAVPGAAPQAPGAAAPGTPMPAPAPPMGGQMQTFAQMQRAGLPRPAPVMPQMPGPTPTFQAPQAPLGDATQQAMAQQLAQPTGFDDAAVQRAFQQLSGGVDDDYNTRDRQINEEMARRGLHASSVGAGRLSDSNLSRRSAKEGIATDLLTEQARSLASARSQAIAQSLGAQQQQFGQAADVYGLNRSAGQQDFQNTLQGTELAESMHRGDREYGLQSGQLGLEAELGRGELGLRGELGRGELGLARDRYGLESELGRGELGLRGELGRGELGLARDRYGLESELGRGELGLRGRQLDADIAGTAEDRALRRELGLGDLGLQRDRFGLEGELGRGSLDLNRNEQSMRGLEQLMDLLQGTNLYTDEIGWEYDKNTHRYVPPAGEAGRGYNNATTQTPRPAGPAGAPWGAGAQPQGGLRASEEEEALAQLFGGRMPVLY